jgi:hypothetical protein
MIDYILEKCRDDVDFDWEDCSKVQDLAAKLAKAIWLHRLDNLRVYSLNTYIEAAMVLVNTLLEPSWKPEFSQSTFEGYILTKMKSGIQSYARLDPYFKEYLSLGGEVTFRLLRNYANNLSKITTDKLLQDAEDVANERERGISRGPLHGLIVQA